MSNIEISLNKLYEEYRKINKDALTFTDMLTVDRNIAIITTYQDLLNSIDKSKYQIIEKNLKSLESYISKFSN